MARSTLFSACGRYRYRLARTWDPARPVVGFVLLNPSTADQERDDPTVRRCAGFAALWGFGGLVIANLFALRASHPLALIEARDTGSDVRGPENAAHLRALAEQANATAVPTVVLGWGAHAAALDGADYPADVAAGLAAAGARLVCLGRCRDGAPRHPLYLPLATTPQPWTPQPWPTDR